VRGRSAPHAGLDERLVALAEAVEAGRGVAPDHALLTAGALLDRAGERLGHGVAHTVVALAGATGSGKSSTFNALVGAAVSTVGVRRPTTSKTSAASWGEGADGLLDWLAVPNRHPVPTGPGDPLDGLVLLDLPDHDSTALDHRLEVDRVVGVADMVVWVLDPQKYADAAVHDRYLKPLAGHAGVLLVVLNQADLLRPAELAACRADVARLLADDGLAGVQVLATSARTGDGVPELRRALADRVGERAAAVARLEADVSAVVRAMDDGCDGPARGAGVARGGRAELVRALGAAGGIDVVTRAAAGSHRGRGVAATGWPFTRWLGRLRPDPLRRLHLGSGGGSAARTSLPPPSDVAVAHLRTSVRGLAERSGAGLPGPWGDVLRDELVARTAVLAPRLDATVARTDLGGGRDPRWWRAVGALQVVLAVVAVVGAVWLAVLFGLGYLQLDDVGTPDVGPLPLPTALLLGGAVAGLLVAVLARPLLALGARRRARRARHRLEVAFGELADVELVGPAEAVLERHRRYCDALARAR
jgi:GTP-binding protein EngB required for normal cell division